MAEEESVAAGEAKRQRTEGAMPEDLRLKIEKSLFEIGEVDFRKRSHHGSGPMKRRVLPPEDLVHEKTETIRKGTGNRITSTTGAATPSARSPSETISGTRTC